jgi:WXG100 family type VII secretion target
MGERVIIPGDPAGLDALAGQLHGAAGDVQSVQSRVASNSLGASWSGQAANAFRNSLDQLPGEIEKVVGAFNDAGSAVSSFAGRLAELQQAAAWHNQQVERSEQERDEAEANARNRERELQEAQRAHAAATDPLSLSGLQRAVETSDGLCRTAIADVEDTASRLTQLLGAGSVLHNDYEAAVSACCAALDAARHAAGRTFLRWLGDQVGGIAHATERLGGVIVHDAESVVRDSLDAFHDAAHWVSEHWEEIREAIEKTAMIFAVVTLGAILVVGTGGAAVVALGLVTAALYGTVLAGDGLEAADGNQTARKRLLGDAFDFATSAFGAGAGLKAFAEEGQLASDAAAADSDAEGVGKVVVMKDDPQANLGGPGENWLVNAADRDFNSGQVGKEFEALSNPGKNAIQALNTLTGGMLHGLSHKIIDHVSGIVDKPSNEPLFLQVAEEVL